MKTLTFEKVRLGWELKLDGVVIALRITPAARSEILLIAVGVIAGFETQGVALQVEQKLVYVLRERGLWKEKAPYTT